MTKETHSLDRIHERLEALEAKLDRVMLRLDGLIEKLERGENYPLRNMPQPGDLNDDIHIPGLG
jgi:hypothetical protein